MPEHLPHDGWKGPIEKPGEFEAGPKCRMTERDGLRHRFFSKGFQLIQGGSSIFTGSPGQGPVEVDDAPLQASRIPGHGHDKAHGPFNW